MKSYNFDNPEEYRQARGGCNSGGK